MSFEEGPEILREKKGHEEEGKRKVYCMRSCVPEILTSHFSGLLSHKRCCQPATQGQLISAQKKRHMCKQKSHQDDKTRQFNIPDFHCHQVHK